MINIQKHFKLNNNYSIENDRDKSQESVINTISMIKGIITTLIKIISFIVKKTDKEIKINNVINTLMKNEKTKPLFEDFSREIYSFGDILSTLSKSDTIEKNINDSIISSLSLDNKQNLIEFHIGKSSLFKSKNKQYRDAIHAINSLFHENIFSGEDSNLKEFILKKSACIWFTFNPKDSENLTTSFKKMNDFSKLESVINKELSKISPSVTISCNSINKEKYKNGFSFVDLDIHYKFKKNYSVLKTEILNIINKKI